jgi:hypothetical protein
LSYERRSPEKEWIADNASARSGPAKLEARVPDDEARQQAKQLLAERAARRAEKERQRQAKQQAAEAAASPTQADHAGSL